MMCFGELLHLVLHLPSEPQQRWICLILLTCELSMLIFLTVFLCKHKTRLFFWFVWVIFASKKRLESSRCFIIITIIIVIFF